MKVAITGKGGVGKTLVAASLARNLRDLGRQVVAVDADPDTNLARTLGYRGPDIAPLAKLKELIAKRVGGGDAWGSFLHMNPRVDDIPDQFGVRVDGIRVLVMGSIDRGRSGCACAVNVLLREVLNHLLVVGDEEVVVDMEAGIEHLGRGTAEGVDLMLVVVEPGWASLQTAARIKRLAADLGISRLGVVANRVTCEADLEYVRENLDGLPLLAVLPLDSELERDTRAGVYAKDRKFHQQIAQLAASVALETR